jgi:hypothetical protein
MNDRIEQKIDKIADTLTEQAVTLGRLTVTVEDHVKRTNILEDDIKPIKKHVAMVEGALKFIGLLGILAGIIQAVIWIKH